MFQSYVEIIVSFKYILWINRKSSKLFKILNYTQILIVFYTDIKVLEANSYIY